MRKGIQNRLAQNGRTKLNREMNNLGVVDWLKSRKVDVFLIENDENSIIDEEFLDDIFTELRKNKKKELDEKSV